MPIATTWREPRDLQHEPAIARAQVNHVHTGFDAHLSKHTRRIGPQRLPPAGGRHFGPFEKAERLVVHGLDLQQSFATVLHEVVVVRQCFVDTPPFHNHERCAVREAPFLVST
jgi:hypothetical protein